MLGSALISFLGGFLIAVLTTIFVKERITRLPGGSFGFGAGWVFSEVAKYGSIIFLLGGISGFLGWLFWVFLYKVASKRWKKKDDYSSELINIDTATKTLDPWK